MKKRENAIKSLKAFHNIIKKILLFENKVDFYQKSDRITLINKFYNDIISSKFDASLSDVIDSFIKSNIKNNISVKTFNLIKLRILKEIISYSDGVPFVYDCQILSVFDESFDVKNKNKLMTSNNRIFSKNWSEISLRNFNTNKNINRFTKYDKSKPYFKPSVRELSSFFQNYLKNNDDNMVFEFLFLKTVGDLSQILYCFDKNNSYKYNVFGTMDEICAYISGYLVKLYLKKKT